jgi:alpha-N-acetylglucosaminidase
MKKYLLLLLVLISVHFMATAQLNKQAAMDLIKRILPADAENFEVQYIPKENGKDVFEIESKNGHIILKGNNGVSVASAFNYYLKIFAHCDITWNGTNLHVPHPLPQVPQLIHKISPYHYRYYLNYCTFNYSMSWWNWQRWQWEIDWMAMNGINMPLAVTGEEAIWDKVYKQLGFTEKQLSDFYSGPAYFSWFRMGNLDGWGGPLPESWMQSHEQLQQQILLRERSFGMTPVLPAFSGHVPPAFIQKYPHAKFKKTNWGAGFKDVYILDPSDPMFAELGKLFLEQEKKTYGTDHLYSADTFNENTPPTNDSTYLNNISKAVYESMAKTDPDATWVMQGWLFVNGADFWHPTQIKALLNAVPDNHMIILDLWSETNPAWQKTDAYYGKPWIWCMLQNFGGNVSLFGRMKNVAHDPAAALHDPKAGKLVGIGLTPEGIEQNPALYELMMDNTWRSTPIDLDKWLTGYATRRYGQPNADADSAWMILKNTVYNGSKTEGGPESIITGRPTFDSSTEWTHTQLFYDPLQLVRAWKLLIKAAPQLQNSDGFQYDLVDVTRQVLANYATPMQQKFVQAYHNNNLADFEKYSQQFLTLMDNMDKLLATRKDFLLGKWIADARSWGTTQEEKNLYEWNARDLITLWGDKNSPLHEYACKQWSGLIKGFYEPRWQQFFQYVEQQMRNKQPVDVKAFDEKIKNWEAQWTHEHQLYPSQPQGNPVKMAEALYQQYEPVIEKSYGK